MKIFTLTDERAKTFISVLNKIISADNMLDKREITLTYEEVMSMIETVNQLTKPVEQDTENKGMSEQEYNIQMKHLDNEFTAAKKRYATAKRELSIKYVLSNNPYQIGDIVKSIENQIVRITDINVGYSQIRNKYMCVYTGILLKKDLTPKCPQHKIEVINIKTKIR